MCAELLPKAVTFLYLTRCDQGSLRLEAAMISGTAMGLPPGGWRAARTSCLPWANGSPQPNIAGPPG